MRRNQEGDWRTLEQCFQGTGLRIFIESVELNDVSMEILLRKMDMKEKCLRDLRENFLFTGVVACVLPKHAVPSLAGRQYDTQL